jgi:transposase
MDMGDRFHEVCVLDAAGQVVERKRLVNSREALRRFFGARAPATIAMEAGTHSGWISRLLESMGHRVVVGQPRALRAIWDRERKNDVSDAEMRARLVRVDARLLRPVRHRSEQAQVDLLLIKARGGLVETRTKLINQVRGLAKSLGYRLPSSDARSFASKARAVLPEALRASVDPLLEVVEEASRRIHAFDRQVEQLAQQRYPHTEKLRSVPGVGSLTSLAYVLTLDDPGRFRRSREVGPYLGLTPKQDQSGETDKQLRITKAGDRYMRQLLVGSAQYLMGPFGPACELRVFGQRLAARGGKNAKKRAVVAVACKLAVLLHRLWVSGPAFEPERGGGARHVAAAA